MRRPGRTTLVMALLAASLAGAPALADGRPAFYTLAIGNNAVPGAIKSLEPLHFADDDAVAVYQLARELGHAAVLLTTLDPDSQGRHRDLGDAARPPTRAELARALGELNAAMASAAQQGSEPTLLLFYSGHGLAEDQEAPGLALADGRITHQYLYDEVLAHTTARMVHLVVDACHSEEIVRARDVRAETSETSPADLNTFLKQRTLAAFPQVGVVVASTSAGQTHEWDAIGAGVFTHEVLSALRGGADVNGDRRVEYSEMAAFLSAANRQVVDPRARPNALVRPPQRFARAAIIEPAPLVNAALLVGQPGWLGPLYVEDGQGNRLASLHAEPGHRIQLLLPAGIDLFVRSAQGEAATVLTAGSTTQLERLGFRKGGSRPRGPLERSFREGLFARAFGPAYYSGFVDRGSDFAPVSVPNLDPPSLSLSSLDTSPPVSAPRSRAGAYLAWGAAVPFTIASGALGIMALDARSEVKAAQFERESQSARDRYATLGWLAVGAGVAALVSGVVGYYLSNRLTTDAPGPRRGDGP